MLKLAVQAHDEPTGPRTADYTGDYTQRDRDRALDKLERFLQRDEFRELTYRIGSALWGGVPEHVSDEQIGDMMHSDTGETAFCETDGTSGRIRPSGGILARVQTMDWVQPAQAYLAG